MRFQNDLNGKLSSVSISTILSESDIQTSILTEDERSKLSRIIAAVKRLLSIDIQSLFRFAETGGEVTESAMLISDLWPDIIFEAIDSAVVKPVLQGNYYKILEIRVTSGDVIYRGYMIERLNVDNDKITQFIQSSMANWKPGVVPPFRWFRTQEDAARELEVEERKLSTRPLKKPTLGKVSKGVDVQKVAMALSQHLKRPDVADKIINLDRNELMKIAQAGKNAAKGMSTWDLGKKIFLAYLALGAIVAGLPGIAALIIGFFVVLGIDMQKEKQDTKPETSKTQALLDKRLKELADKAAKGELSPTETRQLERLRNARIRAMRRKAEAAL